MAFTVVLVFSMQAVLGHRAQVVPWAYCDSLVKSGIRACLVQGFLLDVSVATLLGLRKGE